MAPARTRKRPPTREELTAAAREAKMAELFEGRRYKVIQEVHLPVGEVFVTPFGNQGRHGWALQEVGRPRHKFIVGKAVLGYARDIYDAIVD